MRLFSATRKKEKGMRAGYSNSSDRGALSSLWRFSPPLDRKKTASWSNGPLNSKETLQCNRIFQQQSLPSYTATKTATVYHPHNPPQTLNAPWSSSAKPFCSPPKAVLPWTPFTKHPNHFRGDKVHFLNIHTILHAWENLVIRTASKADYKCCLRVQHHSCEYLYSTWRMTDSQEETSTDLQQLFTTETSPGPHVLSSYSEDRGRFLRGAGVFLVTFRQGSCPDNMHRGWSKCRVEVLIGVSPRGKRLDRPTRTPQPCRWLCSSIWWGFGEFVCFKRAFDKLGQQRL